MGPFPLTIAADSREPLRESFIHAFTMACPSPDARGSRRSRHGDQEEVPTDPCGLEAVRSAGETVRVTVPASAARHMRPQKGSTAVVNVRRGRTPGQLFAHPEDIDVVPK